jgi:hypothetical protein
MTEHTSPERIEAFLTELMRPPSISDLRKELVAGVKLREIEEIVERQLKAGNPTGEIAVILGHAIDRSQVGEGVGYVYLDDDIRITIALTADVLVPVEDVLCEVQGDDGEWRALRDAEVQNGSLIWLACEHWAGEMLSRECSYKPAQG